MLELFVALIAITGIVIAIVFNTKYKNRKWDMYYPNLAWMRGLMYFSFCWTLSYLTGGMALILDRPGVHCRAMGEPKLAHLYGTRLSVYCSSV